MARISPVRRLHQEAEAALVAYGPEDHPEGAVELVETFGELELEYAALRKHCVLVDQPHRAIIEITGKDRMPFLDSMLTQDLDSLPDFSCRHSFWLNNKGRIDSDLRVLILPDRVLLDVDIHAAERTLATLSGYVIAEDVIFRSLQEETHRFALHGPSGQRLLHELAGTPSDGLANLTAAPITLFGHDTTVYRDDSTGAPGLELIVPASGAVEIYQKLVDAGRDHDEESTDAAPRSLAARIKLRPAGWHAYNVARIEAGTPLYNIDFGTESLPAESGVLLDRVSFKKGCYLGQEIVARMHARGHPKQQLVALKFESKLEAPESLPLQPIAEATLSASPGSDPIGAVTSSALSPMLGALPVGFAQVRWAHVAPGTVLYTVAEGAEIKGVVQSSLTFWPAPR